MSYALNAICPYFTMFPLEFPLGILSRHALPGQTVLDPFSGRGTTLYAARLQGLSACGIDSNPVATAISRAKLANAKPDEIIAVAETILNASNGPIAVPSGDFWKLAYHEDVLLSLCRLRAGLILNSSSDSRKALLAIVLGALHGPLGKSQHSYFSNQCPRTYAPKPRYAEKYWRTRGMSPPNVDIIKIIARRASRYFGTESTTASGEVLIGDSRQLGTFEGMSNKAKWILTSPPYYGMRTYIPDQWLRNWFLGGPAQVDYSNSGQLAHTSPQVFAEGMRAVWRNCALNAADDCKLIVRFGAINDRKVNSLSLIKNSLAGTPWRIVTIRKAGCASTGKRQADHFVTSRTAIEEYDIWAQLTA